jgi:hypothetical protein
MKECEKLNIIREALRHQNLKKFPWRMVHRRNIILKCASIRDVCVWEATYMIYLPATHREERDRDLKVLGVLIARGREGVWLGTLRRLQIKKHRPLPILHAISKHDSFLLQTVWMMNCPRYADYDYHSDTTDMWVAVRVPVG